MKKGWGITDWRRFARQFLTFAAIDIAIEGTTLILHGKYMPPWVQLIYLWIFPLTIYLLATMKRRK